MSEIDIKSLNEQIASITDYSVIFEQYINHIIYRNNGGMAVCPFHIEKTPSFSINFESGLYHCFGCGEKGNIYQFIQKIHNCTWHESIKIIAELFNIPIIYKESKTKHKTNNEILLEINTAAMQYYHDMLFNSKIAQNFLYKKNITPDIIKKYYLGAAINSQLYQYLIKLNFPNQIIKLSSLIKEKDGQYVDFFYNRIIYPIFNINNHVIGFSGRTIDNKRPDTIQSFKYLNIKNTILYTKKETLYGIEKAKRHIINTHQVTIVEGFNDVIACHLSNINNAVALSGTALSTEHITQLKSLAGNEIKITLFLDSDNAGINAILKAVYILPTNILINCSVLTIDQKYDPWDIYQKYGHKYLYDLYNNKSISYLLFYLQHDIKKDDPNATINILYKISNLMKITNSSIIYELCIKYTGVILQQPYDKINQFYNEIYRKQQNNNTNTLQQNIQNNNNQNNNTQNNLINNNEINTIKQNINIDTTINNKDKQYLLNEHNLYIKDNTLKYIKKDVYDSILFYETSILLIALNNPIDNIISNIKLINTEYFINNNSKLIYNLIINNPFDNNKQYQQEYINHLSNNCNNSQLKTYINILQDIKHINTYSISVLNNPIYLQYCYAMLQFHYWELIYIKTTNKRKECSKKIDNYNNKNKQYNYMNNILFFKNIINHYTLKLKYYQDKNYNIKQNIIRYKRIAFKYKLEFEKNIQS